jgi:hypothetical protein
MSAEPEFQTALELSKKPAAELIVPNARRLLVVRPEVKIQEAKDLWNDLLEFRGVILEDPECADDIDGSREMNRTGATRLAVAFGLSIREDAFTEGRVQDATTSEYDYRYLLRVTVFKGDRSVAGIGSCRISEIPATSKKGTPVPIGQREHFAIARAWTRATKRAIADILGGTEA